ncbi:hypothetical protein RI054_19g87740 [Pseudoscourfieldia marina]
MRKHTQISVITGLHHIQQRKEETMSLHVEDAHVTLASATATESHGDANEEAHRRAADRLTRIGWQRAGDGHRAKGSDAPSWTCNEMEGILPIAHARDGAFRWSIRTVSSGAMLSEYANLTQGGHIDNRLLDLFESTIELVIRHMGTHVAGEMDHTVLAGGARFDNFDLERTFGLLRAILDKNVNTSMHKIDNKMRLRLDEDACSFSYTSGATSGTACGFVSPVPTWIMDRLPSRIRGLQAEWQWRTSLKRRRHEHAISEEASLAEAARRRDEREAALRARSLAMVGGKVRGSHLGAGQMFSEKDAEIVLRDASWTKDAIVNQLRLRNILRADSMDECFMSIVVLVLERLGEREYAKWLREEYGKEPFEYWYVTATRVVGLRSDNQAQEAYNKTVKAYKWLGGLRQPADSVLNDAFPRRFQADVRERGAHVRMGLMPTPVDAAESVHRAASLISVKKLYRVDNDVLYMNTSSFGEYVMSSQRVKNFENARAGRLDPVKASKLSIAELTWLYASVHRVAPVEKCNEVVFARRPMVCTCHRCWHMETCSHCASYEHIVLKERDLVKETEPLPRNNRAGAPKKSKGALSKQ